MMHEPETLLFGFYLLFGVYLSVSLLVVIPEAVEFVKKLLRKRKSNGRKNNLL